MLFSMKEFHERLLNTKKRMEAEGMDVLLVTDPANMNYLSGYDAWSFYVPQLLVVILNEDQPFWIGRGLDVNAAKYTTWLDQNHIRPYGDQYVQSSIRHPMDVVADFIKGKKLDKQTIGMELDAYYFTAKSYIQLAKGLPEAKLRDATNLVNWVRSIKSNQEIVYMKQAAKISEEAMQAAYSTLNEGVRESEVAAIISYAQISGTEEFGGDYPSIVPLLPTGEKTSASHLTWTDAPLRAGDPVIIELAGCYNRYHSPLTRTAVIGEPSEEMNRLSEVMIEGVNEALEIIKPGVTCEEVELAWRKSLDKNGYKKESRLGYSVGLNYPPDWGEHTASLRPEDQTVLKPNMTFHMIPIMHLGNMGMEISETFRVTETGYELLSNFPRELFVKSGAYLT